MLALKTILARNEDCPVKEIGDGLVIGEPTGELTHSLEEIGAFIWRCIDGKKTMEDLLADLLAEYDVSPRTAAADLQAFVDQLLAAGLLKTV
jgi:hypothetical protein